MTRIYTRVVWQWQQGVLVPTEEDWYDYEGPIAEAKTNPFLNQTHFRFRSDTGAVDDAPTWMADQDVNINVDVSGGNVKLRCRMCIQEQGGADKGTTPYSLHSNLNSWAEMGTGSSGIRMADAGASADGAAITVKRLTGTGSMSAGLYDETGQTANTPNITANNCGEFEWGLELVAADLTDGQIIDLRVYASSTSALNGYAVTARITVSKNPGFGSQKNSLSDTQIGASGAWYSSQGMQVEVGDLVLAVVSQNDSSVTCTGVADAGTGGASNQFAPLEGGAMSGCTVKAWWCKVAAAGALMPYLTFSSTTTTPVLAMTVLKGPFPDSPVDKNPAVITDSTSPFDCPSTGTLSQADELVLGYMNFRNIQSSFASTAPSTLLLAPTRGNITNAAISARVVSSTAAVAPQFTNASNASAALGTVSFKKGGPCTVTLSANEGLTGSTHDLAAVTGKANVTLSGGDSLTVALLHMDGADGSTSFADECGHTFTPHDNLQIDTAQSVFGGASAYWQNVSPGYLTGDASADLALGTGDFVIDFWLRPQGGRQYAGLIDFRPSGQEGAYPTIYWLNGGGGYVQLRFYANGGDRIWPSNPPAIGNILVDTAWVHIALVRSSGVTRMFSDGVQFGGDYTDANNYGVGAGAPVIGNYSSLDNPAAGWLDELRISKGTDRGWFNGFTPPASPYSLGVKPAVAAPGNVTAGVSAHVDLSMGAMSGACGDVTVHGIGKAEISGASGGTASTHDLASVQAKANVTLGSVGSSASAGDVSVQAKGSVTLGTQLGTAAPGDETVQAKGSVTLDSLLATGAAGEATAVASVSVSVSLDGVSASAACGDISTQAQAVVQIGTQLGSTAQGDETVEAKARVTLDGVEASGAAGDVTATAAKSVSFELVGVAGTADAGAVTVGISAHVDLASVEATGSVGDASAKAAVAPVLSGFEATGSAGDASAVAAVSVSVQLGSGIPATASGGAVTVAATSQVVLDGVQATGQLGELSETGRATVQLAQDTATAAEGAATAEAEATAQLGGHAASAAQGEASTLVAMRVQLGAPDAAAASVGATSFMLPRIVALDGFGAASGVGELAPTTEQTVELAGFEASGALGQVSVTAAGITSVDVTGFEASAQLGALSLQTEQSLALEGFQGAGELGGISVALPRQIAVGGFLAASQAGELGWLQANQAPLAGHEAGASVGTLAVALPRAVELAGHGAAAAAGELGVITEQTIALAGHQGSSAVGSPDISTAGNIWVNLLGLEAAAALGSPSLVGKSRVVLSGLGSSAQPGAETVSIAKQVSLAGHAATGSVGAALAEIRTGAELTGFEASAGHGEVAALAHNSAQAAALTTGPTDLEQPALGQHHFLAAADLTVGSPELPLLMPGGFAVEALPLTTGAPELGQPRLRLRSNFEALPLTVGSPQFIHPSAAVEIVALTLKVERGEARLDFLTGDAELEISVAEGRAELTAAAGDAELDVQLGRVTLEVGYDWVQWWESAA